MIEQEGLLDTERNGEGQPKGELRVVSLEYFAFASVGASYLWPWNCLLSAMPYFKSRFEGHPRLQNGYSSTVMIITTFTGVVASLVLAKRQGHFARRVVLGESIIMGVFAVLVLACFVDMGASLLYALLCACVFAGSLGTVFAQNGSFAVAGARSERHTQAIVIGQAVSGVLPPIVSILTTGSGISAIGSALYFLAAVAMAGVACSAFVKVEGRAGSLDGAGADTTAESALGGSVPLAVLFGKLQYAAIAIFATFAVTLAYPVFAGVVVSANGIRPELFVPLVFLVWNLGDLHGRQVCSIPRYVIRAQEILAAYSLARIFFVAALFLTNIRGQGIIKSDLFYLVLQYFFGITNGHLATCALMAAPTYVDHDEREAAGGFMTFSISSGLALGSLFSVLLTVMTS